MADSIVTMHVISRGLTAASDRDRFLRSGQGAREVIERLSERLTAAGSGALSCKLVVRVDGSAGAAASGTVVVDQSDCTAGDKLIIAVPGLPPFVLVAVATDDEAIAGSGKWSIETATDDATGAQIETAINGMPGLSSYVVADNTTGSVAITARHAGTGGNGIKLSRVEAVSTALVLTQLSGGADPGQRPTGLVNFGTADVADDDTISIGSVTFTWKAAPSGENQIETSTTPATAATRFAAAVNAHSKLKGLVSAAADDDDVTITWLDDPRTAQLVTTSSTVANAGSAVWVAAFITPLTTESYGGTAPREFRLGAP